MKKVFIAICALVLTLGMSTSAFAAGADNGNNKSISITNAKTGHTYEAYQIFTGNLDGTTLSNIVWGDNIDTTKLTSANGFSSNEAKTVADSMNAENADAYAQSFNKALTGSPKATATAPSDGKYTLSGLTQGYYLVKDTTGSQAGENDAETLYILRVTANNVEVAPKSDIPTVEKKVEDINDSSTAATKADLTATWADSADYDIGDQVPFKLTATLPTDVEGHGWSDYASYKLVFHDTLSNGFTAPTSTNIADYDLYIGTHKLTEAEKTAAGASVSISGQNVNFTFTNVKAVMGTKEATQDDVDAGDATEVGETISSGTPLATAGGTVSVIYKATLNANCNVGATGNDNEVYLEFSNNPNSGGEGQLGETPKDLVRVFTFKLKITKTDENGDPLTGATFKLQKKNSSGTYVDVASPVIVANNAGTGQNEFTVTGLDDGDYKIVETAAPSGYSKIEDILFTVSATHGDGDDPALTALTATVTNGSSITSGSIGAFTCSTSTGEMAATIQDEKGLSLPGTGGIGTYLIYGFGALALAVAAAMIARRRKAGSEQ